MPDQGKRLKSTDLSAARARWTSERETLRGAQDLDRMKIRYGPHGKDQGSGCLLRGGGPRGGQEQLPKIRIPGFSLWIARGVEIEVEIQMSCKWSR